jgi:hypothetical protein
MKRLVLSGAVASLLLAAVLPTAPAYAQSPATNVHFIAVKPYGSLVSNTGVVVQGLGLGSCAATNLSELETQTVAYLNAGHAAISEISPQSVCGQIAGYESVVQTLTTYVYAHASAPAQLWGGVMLDEETGSPWNFTVTDYVNLNNSVRSTLSGVSGIPWLYTEDFSCNSGCWTLAQYNSITTLSYPAPQIVTSYMVTLANNGGGGRAGNLVTWGPSYPSPYNTVAGATGPVLLAPYSQSFSQPFTWYWSNEWVPT